MKKVMPKGHLVEKYRKFHDAEDLWSIAMATQIQEQREKTAFWTVLKRVLSKDEKKDENKALKKDKEKV